MDTMEMISKALESVVEAKLAEQAKETKSVDLTAVKDFIKHACDEDIYNIFNYIVETTDAGADALANALELNDEFIRTDLIDVDYIENCGLLEDCFQRYLDFSDSESLIEHLEHEDCICSKEFIKHLIDRI